MTAPTTTAALTPEELAKKLDHMSDISLFYNPNDAVDLAEAASAMIRAQDRQIEAQRAEIERLTSLEDEGADPRIAFLLRHANDALRKAEAAEAALAAERDRWIADWQGANAECRRLEEDAGATERTLERVRGELDASQERERVTREALERLESANDALCATRSDKTYASMLDDGAADALLALDAARREARAAVTVEEGK